MDNGDCSLMKYIACLINRYDQISSIGSRIELANGFFTRLKGLLGRTGLAEGEGMLLSPCSSIHCFGMKFSIDIVFLDRNYQVVGIKENMLPGSRASSRKARHVLELKAGEVERHSIKIGEQLEFS